MNRNDRLQWLLQALNNTDAAEFDPNDCEQVQEWLDRYVEDQLRGNPLSRPEYQLVARHLPLCMDCMGDYNLIRENLSELIEAGLPERPGREEMQVTAAHELAAFQQAMKPLDLSDSAAVYRQIAPWRGRVPEIRFATVRTRPAKPADDEKHPTVSIDGLELELRLEIAPAGELFSVRCSFAPAQYQWRGRIMRLYQLLPPVVAAVHEQPINEFDEADFAQVGPGDYLLTYRHGVGDEATELPLALITI